MNSLLNKKIYFAGIGGMGMTSVAGLAKQAGASVFGSDNALFEPTATILKKLDIKVLTPYAKENLDKLEIDFAVIGNALSRDHPEAVVIREKNIEAFSFPSFLCKFFLGKSFNFVVSGTHGKSTTSSLLSFCLKNLELNPSYFIGAQPKDLDYGFHFDQSNSPNTRKLFVLEGDEYDTAYFDKESKFLHYKPSILSINNIEFDHADIFSSIEDIKKCFSKLCDQMESAASICANIDSPVVKELLEEKSIYKKSFKISMSKDSPDADVKLISREQEDGMEKVTFSLPDSEEFSFKLKQTGIYNIANAAMVTANIFLYFKMQDKRWGSDILDNLASSFASFQGAKRRLDLLASKAEKNLFLYEDFAHHPSSIALLLSELKLKHSDCDVIAFFEPKSATTRRSLLIEDFKKSLSLADQVHIAPCTVDLRLEEKDRMNTELLATKIGEKARAYQNFQSMMETVLKLPTENQVLVFMSSGSFDGIHKTLATKL